MLQAKKAKDPHFNAVAKKDFPANLKELMNSVDARRIIPPAFEKCGIFPINKEKVLERIPSKDTSELICENLDSSLLNKLSEMRYGFEEKRRAKRPKGKKVPAGMSYTPDTTEEEEEEDDVDQILGNNSNDDLDGGGDDQIGGEDDIAELPEIDELPETDAGGYVVGLYEGEYYLGEPVQDQTGVLPGYKKISFMKIRGSNQFGWDKPDIFDLPITETCF